MKKAIQVVIIASGVAASIYGVSKMSAETAAMILPVWTIVSGISLVLCAASIGIGFLAKHLLSSEWHQLTFAAIFIIIVVGIYATVEYKPTLNIFVSDYTGEVKLFVSKDNVEVRDITVSNYGIGYITRRDFEKGFYPKVLRGRNDISKEIKEYSKGSVLNNLSDIYSFNFLSFVIPGRSDHSVSNIDELIKVGAIDTTQLARKNIGVPDGRPR